MLESRAPRPRAPLAVLFDVDNTLLDNDHVERDLNRFLEDRFGPECRDRYLAIFERLRSELGYADYLGTLQRFRVEHPRDPDVLALTFFLIEYPFADRLYPRALDVVRHAQRLGLPVLLSDGDVVFQPWKVKRSGLLDAVAGRALIYIHKEAMLDEVERQYPADHYVLIDDKVRILAAVKRAWGSRVTTVFPRQGHYAADAGAVRRYPAPDVAVDRIAGLLGYDVPELLAAASRSPDFRGASMTKQPNATRRLHDLGQSLWVDNITRAMLDSGALEGFIGGLSVTGLTSNPTIFDHAIRNSEDYDATVRRLARTGRSDEDLFFVLALEDLRRAADMFRSIHDRTNGLDGWVSLEVSPLLAYDAKRTIEEAKRLHQQADRANVFIKIPGTPEGLNAIEESIYAGIPINVTLLFSREQYLAAADAYMRGLARRVAEGLYPNVRSVASLFISRWDKKVADRVPAELKNRLGIAVAGRAYRAYLEVLASPRWLALANAGAQPQRMLWASTSTKDPGASDVLYIEALASPFTINTMPDQTLEAFADHGQVRGTLAPDAAEAERTLAAFAKAGIDVDEVAAQLQQEGAEAFSKSWRDLLGCVKERRSAVVSVG